ncbi:MAG: acetyltransferase [Ardenticatenales bacterium]
MPPDPLPPESRIGAARDELFAEHQHLRALGRPLTAVEQARLDALARGVTLIGQGLEVLGWRRPLDADAAPGIVGRDGAWALSAPGLEGELRLDAANGRLSLDLFTAPTTAAGERRFEASVASEPGVAIRPGQSLVAAVGQDEAGRTATGTVQLAVASATEASVTLLLDTSLGALVGGRSIVAAARWQREALRTIRLEVVRENGVPALPVWNDPAGPTESVESALAAAGIAAVLSDGQGLIPTPASGWDESQLHGLMTSFAASQTNQRDWQLHLLLLGACRDPRVFGIMFDAGISDANGLPRQGAAVFTTPIATHPAGVARKTVQTVVHELGHALNLAHRFEAEVARVDSTSFMNYDWRYLGGNQRDRFWHDFHWTFDDDELAFLHHGPWPSVVPGGQPFHSVRYWRPADVAALPFQPIEPSSGLALRLVPPAAGTVFAYAQPVYLTVALVNESGAPRDIPSFYIDPKAGYLQIFVRRLDGADRGPQDAFPDPATFADRRAATGPAASFAPRGAAAFQPIVLRDYELDAADPALDQLPDGASISANLNLTFGSAGFSFAEPGSYEITAVLILSDATRGTDTVTISDPVAIRISFPHTPDEERDAQLLLTRDVGAWLALGGSDVLSDAGAAVEAVRKRRMGRRRKVTDATVAYIVRAEAINASRDFVTYDDGDFSVRRSNPDKAARLLDRLEDEALESFDPSTRAATRRLAQRMERGGAPR